MTFCSRSAATRSSTVVLVAPDRLGERRVGPLDEGQLGLDAIQQLRVEVVHARILPADRRVGESHRRSPPPADGRLFGMRARRVLPLLLVLASVAVVATGCFSSKVANTTITGEITVGEGTTATDGEPGDRRRRARRRTPPRPRRARRRPATTRASTATTTAAAARAPTSRPARPPSRATCGGCHTLKDAGTTGKVGPDLDSLAPLTAETRRDTRSRTAAAPCRRSC